MKVVQTILKEVWEMLLEMSPYLLLGFTIAGVLHLVIPNHLITKHLGNKGIGSILKSTFLGVPLPLCSCGVIPTGVSFHQNGASKGATNAFLISTPQTGIDSILVTSSLMNWPWAIARPIIAFITGIFGGLLTDKVDNEQEKVQAVDECSDCVVPTQKQNWFIRFFHYAFVEFLSDISRQLIVGILIAVAISVFVPQTVFENYLTNPVLNMLIILVASIPLYVCATGSVPIGAALLASGISPGAVLVFLMAGPATNAATITVLWKSMGKRATLAYLFSIIVGAMGFGLLMDYVLPSEWFTISEVNHTHEHGGASIVSIMSAILLIGLILYVEILKIVPKKQIKMENTTIYKVDGMTCNHCKNSVETNLSKLENIEQAIVDLENKSVAVKGKASADEVKNVVDGLGYSYQGKEE